jgi:hypothetical protein
MFMLNGSIKAIRRLSNGDWRFCENRQDLEGGAPSPPNARAALTEQRPPPGSEAGFWDGSL